MADPYGAGEVDEENGLEPEPKALTAEEAAILRPRLVEFSPWHVIAAQGGVGILLVLGVWLVSGNPIWVKSASYGMVAVLVPAMLFARGVTRRHVEPGSVLVSVFVWEFVKIILTLAMLIAAPKVVAELSWLALLAGFVVTMKASWLAMLWQHRRMASLTVV